MGQDGLKAIAERNAEALRPRSISGAIADEFHAAFDKSVPAANRRPKQIALVTICLLLVGAFAAFVFWPRGNAAGGTVRSYTGETVDLDALFDKQRTIVVFYPGKGCECEPFLEELERARPKLNGKVVAISSQPVASAAALHAKLKLGYDLYVDPTFETIPEWKVPYLMAGATTFAVFVVEKGGKIAWKQIGQPVPTWDEVATK